jgi:hypothetical protein
MQDPWLPPRGRDEGTQESQKRFKTIKRRFILVISTKRAINSRYIGQPAKKAILGS